MFEFELRIGGILRVGETPVDCGGHSRGRPNHLHDGVLPDLVQVMYSLFDPVSYIIWLSGVVSQILHEVLSRGPILAALSTAEVDRPQNRQEIGI